MKTINSLNEILELAKNGNLYVRWSRGPAMDKKQGCSRDYVAGGQHNGLSCQEVSADYDYSKIAMMLVEYGFLRRKDEKIYGWLFYGVENGRDSDNAPTVDAESIVPVGKLSAELIAKLTAYKNAYWSYKRTSPKSFAERDEWQAGFPKLSDFVA